MSLTPESASLGDMIRDLLIAMTTSQNEANKNFIAGIEELAGTDVTIGYSKNVGGKVEKREIKGNALAFGVLPTLMSIQSSTIEIRTALTVQNNASNIGKNLPERSLHQFRTNIIDAKYQNTYNYKAEASSIIRITIVPTPPTQEFMEAIKSAASGTITDNPKP